MPLRKSRSSILWIRTSILTSLTQYKIWISPPSTVHFNPKSSPSLGKICPPVSISSARRFRLAPSRCFATYRVDRNQRRPMSSLVPFLLEWGSATTHRLKGTFWPAQCRNPSIVEWLTQTSCLCGIFQRSWSRSLTLREFIWLSIFVSRAVSLWSRNFLCRIFRRK